MRTLGGMRHLVFADTGWRYIVCFSVYSNESLATAFTRNAEMIIWHRTCNSLMLVISVVSPCLNNAPP